MYDAEIHHRRSVRIKGYDYAQEGLYFVTICVQNKQCLFGNIANGKMELNEAGGMVDCWWKKLSQKFIEIELDKYAIMPNHFHGIIVIRSVGAIPCNRPEPAYPEFSVKRNSRGGEKIQEGARKYKRAKTWFRPYEYKIHTTGWVDISLGLNEWWQTNIFKT
jgi:REP element-mobilizing transposase RayT